MIASLLAFVSVSLQSEALQDEALKVLQSRDWAVLVSTIPGRTELAPGFVSALKHESPLVRERAASGMKALDWIPAAGALAEATNDRSALVARKAVYAFVHIARPRRFGKHGMAMGSPVSESVLAKIGESAVPYLIESLDLCTSEGKESYVICLMLKRLKDRKSIPALIRAADRLQADGLFYAADAMSVFQDARIPPALARNIGKEIPDTGYPAQDFLFVFGDAGRKAVENEMLTSKVDWTRELAADMLWKFGSLESEPALLKAMKDPKHRVRMAANESLKKLRDRRVDFLRPLHIWKPVQQGTNEVVAWSWKSVNLRRLVAFVATFAVVA